MWATGQTGTTTIGIAEKTGTTEITITGMTQGAGQPYDFVLSSNNVTQYGAFLVW